MEFTTLCAVVASLRVVPDRSQFFQYEQVNLSCVEQGKSSEWRVKRKTLINLKENRRNGSHWFIRTIYPRDGGLYWCESEAGERRDVINITVTTGDVILESPKLPLMEGDNLTLRCVNKNPSSNVTSDFYKDGLLIGSSSTGTLTIRGVSASDEGLYMCNMSESGWSPCSRLSVREAGRLDPPHTSFTYVVLPVVGVCLVLVSLMLLCLWRSYKGKTQDVSYTNVIITQEVQPRRVKDVDAADAASTFYSTIKLETS